MREMSIDHARVLIAHSDHGGALGPDRSIVGFVFNRQVGRPLAGDWIDIDAAGRLCAIHERKTVFGRGDHAGRFKPTAANVDQLLIVIAPRPAPSADLIARYLVMSELQGIRPIIVLNKKDLGVPTEAPFDELSGLAQLGYRVIETSIHDEASIGELKKELQGKTSLLAGQSGVGKSSLLNCLIPKLDTLTGQLSLATGKGKHTTTTTRLYPLPEGGFLVDSPGVWEYGLWQIPIDQLAAAFIEFRPLIGRCRFRDCTHDHEPGCAMVEAAKTGKIQAFRYDAWRRLLAEQKRYGNLAHHHGKSSPLA